LILRTTQSFTTYAVGVVVADKQQDFGHAVASRLPDYDAALRKGGDTSRARPTSVPVEHRYRGVVSSAIAWWVGASG